MFTSFARGTVRRAVAATAATSALLLAAPQAASAAPSADISSENLEIIGITGVTAVRGGTASVSFNYRCTGTEMAYLWASAKQLDDPNAIDPTWNFDTHGTSGLSASWYDTHEVVPCDVGEGPGRVRHATVELHEWDNLISWQTGQVVKELDPMEAGMAYVQLCLSVGDDDEGELAAYYEWRHAKIRS